MSDQGAEIFLMINIDQFDPKNRIRKVLKKALLGTSGIHKWKSREEMGEADNIEDVSPITHLSRYSTKYYIIQYIINM